MRVNNGSPNQLTLFDAPWAFRETLWDSAFYAQDQWTVMRRLTLNLGVRYNDIDASTPEQVLAAGFFVPERTLPAMKHIPHYQNLNPRLGFAYDLFGNGKTAIKASLGQCPGDHQGRDRQPREQPVAHDEPDVDRYESELRSRLRPAQSCRPDGRERRRVRALVRSQLRQADRWNEVLARRA